MLEIILSTNGNVLTKNTLSYIEDEYELLPYLDRKLDLEKDNLIIDTDFIYMGRYIDCIRVYYRKTTRQYFLYLEERDDILIGTSIEIKNRYKDAIKMTVRDNNGDEIKLDYTEEDLDQVQKNKRYFHDIV